MYSKHEEWKIAVVRCCYITFHVASTYFVCLIVVLRLVIVYKPMKVLSLERKTTKIYTAIIWAFALFLNVLPIIASAGHGKSKQPMMICYFLVLHAGITLPLFLTILANILKIMALKKVKKTKETKKEAKNNENFQKLINGLVIWLIVCNVPYIAWYHWSLDLYLKTGKLWVDVAGVIIIKNLTFSN